MRRRIPALIVLVLLGLLVPGAVLAGIEAKKTEPADGDTLDRPVRTLRVWFNEDPAVEKSELELEGPDGKLTLEGLHTMGDRDLMVRVVGRVPDGEYTARWKTESSGGEVAEGEWRFTIERRAPPPSGR